MKKVIELGIVLTMVVCAVAISSSTSLAQVRVVQTGCDTLSFNPPRVHVNFAIINLTGIPVCSLRLIPIPSGPYPPCEIFDCSVPNPGWQCHADPAGGAQWQTIPGVPCIQPYQKLDNFDIVIDPPYCCYRAEFDDGTNIFFVDTVCFQCESPTSGKVSTWGAVKAMYR